MKIIAITNNKGGVGKTTTAESVGAYLATQGHRTLLVDLDAQGNLTYALNVGMSEPANVGEFLLSTPAAASKFPFRSVGEGLWLLPSHERMHDYQQRLVAKARHEYRLRDLLRAVLVAERFDYVLLDCPPSLLDPLTFGAFCAADLYVVPAEPEPFAVLGLAHLVNLATKAQASINPGLRLGGIVFTRFNPKMRGATRLSMLQQVRDKYGAESVLGHIPQDAALTTAQGFRETIYVHDPESRGAKAYANLTHQILARLN